MSAHPLLHAAPVLNAQFKGYPYTAPPLPGAEVGRQGWNVLAGDLPLPLAVLKQAPLQHNLGWLQQLVHKSRAELAPHGKTTLSPELFQRQLQAGAWGITFASVWQWRQALAAGLRSPVLIANQVVQAADLHELARLLQADPGQRAPFLIDDAAQIAQVAALRLPQALDVLVELGMTGGRTGCRSVAAGLELARAAHASPAVRLAGLSTYEGLWAQGTDDDADLVNRLMGPLRELATAADAEDLFQTPEIILTAGGSALFDLVLPQLHTPLSRPVRALLRSGCYLTHDDGFYRRLVQRVDQRLGCPGGGLQGALEVWAVVQSRPEPGLALLGAGKRDLSFDMGLPTPLQWSPAGTRQCLAAPATWQVSGLNDQHAYLRWPTDGMHPDLAVGDRVALGISHPCTTFDKWRWMPVVDADYTVVDAITTLF